MKTARVAAIRRLLQALVALALSLASTGISPATDEIAMYGTEGPPERNWRPREVAGWPAPFLADDPGTSVVHRVGVEDRFRPGAFLGTFSFWFLVTVSIARLRRLIVARRESSPEMIDENAD